MRLNKMKSVSMDNKAKKNGIMLMAACLAAMIIFFILYLLFSGGMAALFLILAILALLGAIFGAVLAFVLSKKKFDK